ncbi:MAG TPA: hypothetical protein GXX20_09325, partial [Clostridiaceae bacterium]|nr:hypothetical protein [Clostridiaceae bacterium]
MYQKGKRLISLLVTILFVFSILPLNVSADETVPDETTIPANLEKVTKIARVIGEDGNPIDDGNYIIITTANLFEIGNYYGSTQVLFEISGLDFNDNSKNYRARIKLSDDSYETIRYLYGKTSNVEFIDYYLSSAEEGKLDFTITVYVENSNYETELIYETVNISTYLTSFISPMTVEEINSESKIINQANLMPFITFYLPLNDLPADFKAHELIYKLVYSDNEEVYAISDSNYNSPNSYDFSIYDKRYNAIFTVAPVNELTYRVKAVNVSLICGKELIPGQYNVQIFDNQNNLIYNIPNVVTVTDKPYVEIKGRAYEYPSPRTDSEVVYVKINAVGESVNLDDYNLGLYDKYDNLIAKSNGEYKVENVYDNNIEAVYKLNLEDGKKFTIGNYRLKLLDDSVDCIWKESDFYVDDYNATYINKMLVPSSRYANFVAYGNGLASDRHYKAVLSENGVIIAEKMVAPFNNEFDVEFTDSDGEVILLKNKTQYEVSIFDKDYNGEWRNRLYGYSFYNQYHEEEELFQLSVLEAGIPDSSANFSINNRILNGYLDIVKSIAETITDDNKFKVVARNVLGQGYTYDAFQVTKYPREKTVYYNLMQPVFDEMPLGYYKFKVYYQDNGTDVELKKNDGSNIGDSRYYTSYSKAPWISFSYSSEDKLQAINTLWINNIDNIYNAQLILYGIDNFGIEPDHIIDLVSENGGYVFKAADTKNINFHKKYKGILFANGKPVGTMGEFRYFAPIDKEIDNNIYSISLSQVENGTLEAVVLGNTVTNGTVGTEVYIKNKPAEGFQLKPGSIKVNGQPIIGRSFVLTGDSVITAEFEPAFVQKYSIEINQYIYNGEIFVNVTQAAKGDIIQVYAVPYENYKLSRLWYRPMNDTNPENYTYIDLETMAFEMPDEDIVIDAEFRFLNSYYVNIETPKGGRVEGGNNYATEGSIVTLTVIPDPGYRLASLYYRESYAQGDPVEIYGNGTEYSFIMPSAPVTVYAEFEQDNQFQYYITLDMEAYVNGYIKLTPANGPYSAGQQIEVEAIPNYGFKLAEGSLVYRIDGIGESFPIENNILIMPEGNITIYAKFVPVSQTTYYVSIDPIVYMNATVQLIPGYSSYSAGQEIEVLINPISGYRLIEGSLIYKINGVGQEYPIIGNKFTMPEGNITIYAQFEPIPLIPHNITIIPASNGTVTVDKPTALFDEWVDVTIIPDSGYRIKDNTIIVRGTEPDSTYYAQYPVSILPPYKSGFYMPDEDVTILVEFEEKPEIQLFENNKLNIRMSKWDMWLIIPPEYMSQVYILSPYERYIKTVIKDKTGNVVFENKLTDIFSFENYQLYKTNEVSPGTYTAEVTVGDYQTHIYLGKTEIIFGDYLQIQNIHAPSYGHAFTTDTRNFTIEVRLDHLFTDLDNIKAKLVDKNTGSVVAEPLNKRYIYYDAKDRHRESTINENNKETMLSFEFTLSDALKDGNFYELVLDYSKEVVFNHYADREFFASSQPRVLSGIIEDNVITLKSECIPEGEYTVLYYSPGQGIEIPYTMIVDSEGNGTIDISIDKINEDWASFSGDINGYYINFFANREYREDKEYLYIDISNSVPYYSLHPQTGLWSEFAIPLSQSVSFDLNNYTGEGEIKLYRIYNDAIGRKEELLETIYVSSLENGRGTFSYDDFNSYYVYEIRLTDPDDEDDKIMASASFIMPDFPFISIEMYNAQEFYGDILTIPHNGTVNITDFSKIKFFAYSTGLGEIEVPVISMDNKEIKLDMTNAPSGIFKIRSIYKGYKDDEDFDIRTSNDMMFYKVNGNSPVITSAGVQDGTYYAEGIRLNNASSAQVKIFKILENILIYKAQADLVTVSDNRMNIPQDAFSGLEDGRYLAVFIVDGIEQVSRAFDYSAPVATEFTVTFVDHDGSVLKTEVVPRGGSATAPAVPEREGYTFIGWDKPFNNVVSDITVTAQYTQKKYTVTFDSNGGSSVDSIANVPHGSIIEEPATPTKVGYTFDGWYKDQEFTEKWDFETNKVESDITLYANWIINKYSVTFVDFDGTVIDIQTVTHGGSATAPADPTREGYTFTGWDTDFTNVTADITVKATYEINRYTVAFDSRGGTSIESIKNVPHGTTISQPTPPTKEGYGFDGWYKDAELKEKWDFATDKVVSDITLYAKWVENSYTVTFISYDGIVLDTQTVTHGSNISKPNDPTREGHTFGGWYKDEEFTTEWNFEVDVVESDITLYAKWTVNKYTVIFVDWDDTVLTTQEVEYGKGATAPTAPEREGYTFKGWDKEFDNVTGDITVKAIYEINKYTVTFVNWDDTVLETQEVEYGKGATAPTAPEREGYTFKGWDTDFSRVTGNITVKAIYEANKLSVYFNSMGGSRVDPITEIDYGSKVPEPNPPTREGYDFAGWYKDFGLTIPWNFETDVIETNMTLFAKWDAKSYSITVSSSITGGTIIAPETAKEGETVTLTIEPEGSNTLKSIWWTAAGAFANEINIVSNNKAVFIMPGRDIEINAIFNKMTELNVSVNKATSPYVVEVYSVNPYYYDYRWITDGSLDTTFTIPEGTNYYVYVNMGENENWYWERKAVDTTVTDTVAFNIPVTYSISGRVECTNGGLKDVYVYASSDNNYRSAYVDAEGNYVIKGLNPGTYTVGIESWNNKYIGVLTQEVTIAGEDVHDINFSIAKGADLRVNLSKTNGTPAFMA